MKISTPEATALDLVGYARHCGGLDNVATVLAELAEYIDTERLVQAAGHAPTSWVQRLGYLLDLLHEQDKADALAERILPGGCAQARLLPGSGIAGAGRHNRWSIIVNADVDPDL